MRKREDLEMPLKAEHGMEWGLKRCIGGAPVIFEAVPPFLFLALRGSSQGNVSKMLKLDSRTREVAMYC